MFYVLALSFQISVLVRSAYIKCSPTVSFPLLFSLNQLSGWLRCYWKLQLLPWVVLRRPSFQETIQCVNVLPSTLPLHFGDLFMPSISMGFFFSGRPVQWKCKLKIIDFGSGILFPLS